MKQLELRTDDIFYMQNSYCIATVKTFNTFTHPVYLAWIRFIASIKVKLEKEL